MTSRRSVKKTIKCGQCKLEIKEKEENIACDKCDKVFHAQCTKLDKKQYDHLLENESVEYICHLCEGDDMSIKEELKFIRCQLSQLTTIQKSITFLSEQYDDVIKVMKDNKKQLDDIKKENRQLKEEVKNLKTSVKILNDERVKNQCIVIGVKNTTDVSAVDAVVNLAKNVGVEISKENIADAYFLNNRRSNVENKNIIVKFADNNSKIKFMAAKSELQKSEETKKTFVNDFLSKETLALFNYAKTLKSVGYKFVYPRNGKIFVKKNEIYRARVLKNEDDVDALLLEASTEKSRGRSLNRGAAAACNVETSDEEAEGDFVSPVRH